MRYQSFGSLAGKTSSDRRLNIFKLLVGIIIGHWIGQKFYHRPKCPDILESDNRYGPLSEKFRNLDQKFDKNGKIKVKAINPYLEIVDKKSTNWELSERHLWTKNPQKIFLGIE